MDEVQSAVLDALRGREYAMTVPELVAVLADPQQEVFSAVLGAVTSLEHEGMVRRGRLSQRSVVDLAAP